MYGLSFGIMDVEDAHKGAELRIALQRETRVCYPIGAVAGAFAAVAARAAAGPKCPLGSARGRPLRLLRAHLAALGGSRHPGREAGPLGAPPRLWCSSQPPPEPPILLPLTLP